MLRILWADESDVYGIFTVLRSYESKHRVEAGMRAEPCSCQGLKVQDYIRM